MNMMEWDRCAICQKPLNNETNILKLRKIVLGAGLGSMFLGGAALPLLGFGLSGITAGSIAAGLQGPAVVAGSMFAILQSLGATGMGILLFGSIGAAIGVLTPLLAMLGWCEGHDDMKVVQP